MTKQDDTSMTDKRVQLLEARLGPDSIITPDGEDFSFLVNDSKDKQIVFLGESPHWVPQIHEAVVRCSLYL